MRITNADRATSSKNRYFFRRAGGRFEQVTAYHAIDAQQHYLQSLGFTDVNAESEKVEVNAFAADNSYYDPVVAAKVRQQFVNRGILEPLQAVAGD
ncbi:MAG: hypothetical protein M3445_08835 [Actinomycetota bacterium]|nr:hypothetical protein [Actinomycetota bacterium]